MNIGILLPGFSANEDDWAIPVQQHLAREMSQHEDVRIITMRYPHTRTPYQLYDAQVYPLGVGAWTRGFRRFRLWWDTFHLIQHLHQERYFDVLHAMWADETGLVAAWAGKRLGIPVVVSIAGGELVGFEELTYGLQRSAFSRWIVGQALHGANAIVAPCNYTKRLIFEAGYDIDEKKIYTITLGVDADLFCPADTPSQSRHLIHIASLIPIKDQLMLIHAIARLEDMTLDIIGEGRDQHLLEALAEQLKISERVRFVGKVHHLELPDYYQHASLNILTSRHEGLGMVTLEAAACGVPTISTDVGLLPDCPEMGITVPVGDEVALANTIDNLLQNPEHRVKLSKSARAAVENGYTIGHTVERFRALYESLE